MEVLISTILGHMQSGIALFFAVIALAAWLAYRVGTFFAGLRSELNNLENRQINLEKSVSSLEKGQINLEKGVSGLEKDVAEIRTTLHWLVSHLKTQQS